MDFKKLVIILVVAIVIFAVGFGATYLLLTKDNIKDDVNGNSQQVDNSLESNNNDNDNISEENNNTDLNSDDTVKESFREIKITSNLANEIYKLIPTYMPSNSINNLNEYMIYTALTSLVNKNVETDYLIDDSFSAYKEDVVVKEAKLIYGDDISLEFKETSKYTLGLVSDIKNKTISILPESTLGSEEYIQLKTIKEYDDRYEVDMYLVMLEYKYDDKGITTIYVGNKESYTSEIESNISKDKLLDKMNIYNPKNDKISVDELVTEYSDKLPVLTYTIKKDNNNKMYVEKIVYNY